MREGPTMNAIAKTLFYARIRGVDHPVASLRDASERFCAARDGLGIGSTALFRAVGNVILLDADRRTVGYVSYNGRVWSGSPRDWKPGSVPLYDNR